MPVAEVQWGVRVDDEVGVAGADAGPRPRARRLRSVPHHGTAPAAPAPAAPSTSFDDFFVQQAPGILALLVTLTGDRGHAEDLTQEAFVKAYRDWGRISGYDKPGAWVRRVAINAAVSAGRRKGSEVRALSRAWAAGRDDMAPDVAELADDSAELWALVRALPHHQAAAVALHYVDDASVADIAAALGCSVSTAKVHLHRGRLALASRLGEPEPEEVAE